MRLDLIGLWRARAHPWPVADHNKEEKEKERKGTKNEKATEK